MADINEKVNVEQAFILSEETTLVSSISTEESSMLSIRSRILICIEISSCCVFDIVEGLTEPLAPAP